MTNFRIYPLTTSYILNQPTFPRWPSIDSVAVAHAYIALYHTLASPFLECHISRHTSQSLLFSPNARCQFHSCSRAVHAHIPFRHDPIRAEQRVLLTFTLSDCLYAQIERGAAKISSNLALTTCNLSTIDLSGVWHLGLRVICIYNSDLIAGVIGIAGSC